MNVVVPCVVEVGSVDVGDVVIIFVFFSVLNAVVVERGRVVNPFSIPPEKRKNNKAVNELSYSFFHLYLPTKV